MPLSTEEVIAIIEGGVSTSIAKSRKQAEKINMHITGQNVKSYLETLDDYETQAQKKLREKLVKSTRSLFSFILRPSDKIFTAKGGSINYNLSKEKISFLKRNISSIADGLDIKKYLKKVVKKHYIIDPNGILFIDIDKDGALETYVIDTRDIFWYDNKGNTVKGLIFEPYKQKLTETERKVFESISDERLKKEEDKIYFRVMDEVSDRIFVNDSGKISLVPNSEISNYFGFVPAMILGDEKDYNSDVFESVIADVVDDADEYLRDLSIKTVHKLAHAYPRYWSYAQACTRCEGEGEIAGALKPNTDPQEYEDATPCTSCGGDGQKKRSSPSDEMILNMPEDGEQKIAPEVAGYVSPDLETAKFYETSLKEARNLMFQAMWGTTYEQSGKRETATGRWLDKQPVEDRLRDISYTFARYHKFMLDCYGIVILRNKSYESSVSYGTRYNLEGADDILKMYMDASKENISELGILDMRNRYFEAEYESDPLELAKRKKLSLLEPFPTQSVKDVIDAGVYPDDDILKKIYYSTWVQTLTPELIIFKTPKQLEDAFNIYIKTKTLQKNEKNTD